MNDDGHMIDDPMYVVNVKPDFTGMGLKPYGIPITIKGIIGDVPPWIKFLPDDYDGRTERAHITFEVSKLAIANAMFCLDGFIATKLTLSLKHIMQKHGMSEICLTNNFSVTVDAISHTDKTSFHFLIEYARK